MRVIGSLILEAFAGVVGSTRRSSGNPELVCTLDEARAELSRMARDRRPLARPILVLGAYHAWPPVVWAMVRKLRRLTGAGENEIVGVSYQWETSLRAASEKGVKRAVDAWGLAPGGTTQQIDVVGLSMGGLIARMVSSGDNEALGLPPDLPRLDAKRIFTFGSPMQGSRRAMRIRPDQAARDMRPGSAIIERIQSARGPEIISYGQLRDQVVGATRTAPRGMEPIWSSGTLLMSHFTTPHNPWFLADMARRLRGEEPLLSADRAPPRD